MIISQKTQLDAEVIVNTTSDYTQRTIMNRAIKESESGKQFRRIVQYLVIFLQFQLIASTTNDQD